MILTAGGNAGAIQDSNGKPLLPELYAAVTLGRIAGWTRGIFKGYVPVASPPTYIWTGGSFSWQSSAQSAEVLSSSANDTSGGTGARTIVISGINAEYTSVSETVTLNGTGVVAAVNQYRHVNSVRVASVGSGQTNAGAITVRIAGAGATIGHVLAGSSASQSSMLMTAANQVYLSLNQVLSSTTNANVSATFVQEFYSPDGILTRDNYFTLNGGGNNPFTLKQDIPLIVPEKTGFGWRLAAVDSGTPVVTARVQGMFVNVSQSTI